MKKVLLAPIGLFAGIIVIVLFFATIANGFGLLLGFEYDSPMCQDYRNHNMTRLAFYGTPVVSYACRKNGGLLQPAVSDFFEWITDKGPQHE